MPRLLNMLVLILALASVPAVCAQIPAAETEATSQLDQAAWLAGRWVGTGMGGEVEEVWSPASGGQGGQGGLGRVRTGIDFGQPACIQRSRPRTYCGRRR